MIGDNVYSPEAFEKKERRNITNEEVNDALDHEAETSKSNPNNDRYYDLDTGVVAIVNKGSGEIRSVHKYPPRYW